MEKSALYAGLPIAELESQGAAKTGQSNAPHSTLNGIAKHTRTHATEDHRVECGVLPHRALSLNTTHTTGGVAGCSPGSGGVRILARTNDRVLGGIFEAYQILKRRRRMRPHFFSFPTK